MIIRFDSSADHKLIGPGRHQGSDGPTIGGKRSRITMTDTEFADGIPR